MSSGKFMVVLSPRVLEDKDMGVSKNRGTRKMDGL